MEPGSSNVSDQATDQSMEETLDQATDQEAEQATEQTMDQTTMDQATEQAAPTDQANEQSTEQVTTETTMEQAMEEAIEQAMEQALDTEQQAVEQTLEQATEQAADENAAVDQVTEQAAENPTEQQSTKTIGKKRSKRPRQKDNTVDEPKTAKRKPRIRVKKQKQKKRAYADRTFGTDDALQSSGFHIPWCQLAFRSPWGRLDRYRMIPDETIGWANHVVSSERPERYNPFFTGTAEAPPRPSMLRHVLLDGAAQMTNTCHLYDRSALVSAGMVLEDMITALLYPYAQAHVKRCRNLVVQEDNVETNTTEYTDEWLLPFDEAIAKLDDPSLVLCTTQPPTRTMVLGDPPIDTQMAWSHWCNSQSLPTDELEMNRNVFSNRCSAIQPVHDETTDPMLKDEELPDTDEPILLPDEPNADHMLPHLELS